MCLCVKVRLQLEDRTFSAASILLHSLPQLRRALQLTATEYVAKLLALKGWLAEMMAEPERPVNYYIDGLGHFAVQGSTADGLNGSVHPAACLSPSLYEKLAEIKCSESQYSTFKELACGSLLDR